MERIRAHTAPRTAVVWDVLRAELASRAAAVGSGLDVLDVGGGTGGFAVPLATAGHRVTVVDSSPDALAALTRRAAEAGAADRIRAVQGDADKLTEIVGAASSDLVLCHSVLEVVDSPVAAAESVAAVLRPGGAASVLVANRAAAVLTRALGGNLAMAATLLADPEGRAGPRDTLLRRFDAAQAEALLAAAGLRVEQIHGVRVVADLVPGALLDTEPGAYDALLAFEQEASTRAPYRDIATQVHLLARRP
ncbi:MAG: methyltransferase domain-containing protein [Micromonosporaceae bacterium]|nr:methyltransferase domain-containing protein [Micromonosporaceae bacterium]